MLKLHGFAVSNYTNMVHLALLEKGIPFEYAQTYPDQSPGVLAQSPRGKVPYLDTPEGFINETNVILEYLEDLGTGAPLLPSNPFQRALVRSLMKEIELYVELPARTCYAEAIFGGKVPDPIKDKARDELTAGIATLGRHAKFSPYIAGRRIHARRHHVPVLDRASGAGCPAPVRSRPVRPAARCSRAAATSPTEAQRGDTRTPDRSGNAGIHRSDSRQVRPRQGLVRRTVPVCASSVAARPSTSRNPA